MGFLVRNSVVAKVVLPQKGLNVNKEGVKEDLMTNQETLIGEIHVLVGPMELHFFFGKWYLSPSLVFFYP